MASIRKSPRRTEELSARGTVTWQVGAITYHTTGVGGVHMVLAAHVEGFERCQHTTQERQDPILTENIEE